VRLSASVQRVLTGGKVLAIVAVILAAVAAAPSATAPVTTVAPTGTFAPLSLAALVAVLWAYDGWSDVTLVAGEVKEPGRNIGRTVLLGSAILVALYGGVQLAVSHVLGGATGSSENAFTATVERGLGPAAGSAVAWIVLVSTLGALHGVTFAASRIGYAMARDGAFFRAFYRVHPRFKTPARSVIALSAAAIVYVLATGFRELVFHFSFNVWLFYAATAVCLLRLRRWGTGEPLAWRAPGGPLAPAVVLLTAAGISGSLFLQSPTRAAVGLALLLSGFPIWLLWRWVRHTEPAPS
jgi:basic amino acid/polyamine antiporter, APA family